MWAVYDIHYICTSFSKAIALHYSNRCIWVKQCVRSVCNLRAKCWEYQQPSHITRQTLYFSLEHSRASSARRPFLMSFPKRVKQLGKYRTTQWDRTINLGLTFLGFLPPRYTNLPLPLQTKSKCLKLEYLTSI